MEHLALASFTDRQLHIYTSFGATPMIINQQGKYVVRMFHTETHCSLLKGEPINEDEFHLTPLITSRTLKGAGGTGQWARLKAASP